MKCTPEIRNICVICFLIIIFLCWLLHAWVYRNNPLEAFSSYDLETADCNEINDLIEKGTFKGNIVNLVPCKSFQPVTHVNGWFTRYDSEKSYTGSNLNQWWREYHDDSGRVVKEVEGTEEKTVRVSDITSLDGNQLKTNYMTIGFWIYIKSGVGSSYMRPIIQFGAENDSRGHPSPSIVLHSDRNTHIKITRYTSSSGLNGADNYTELMSTLPIAKPSYITITFHPKTYSLYVNGRFVQSSTNDEEDISFKDDTNDTNDTRYISLGSFHGDDSFLLRNVELFSTPLTEHEVKKLYCDKKQEYVSLKSHPTESFQTIEGFTSGDDPINIIDESELTYNDGNENVSEFKKTTLDKAHFTKLVNDKELKYIEFTKEQYLRFDPFSLEGGGFTIMFWYRPKMATQKDDSTSSEDLYNSTNSPKTTLFNLIDDKGYNTAGVISHKALWMWNRTTNWRDYYWWNTRIGNIANGNQWYHYAVTISPKNRNNDEATWNIYHNGIPYHKDQTLSYPQLHDGTKTYTDVKIGSDTFTGAIGEFRIYKSELSESQIIDAMNR